MTNTPLVFAYFLSAGLLLMQALFAAILARPGLIPAQRPYANAMQAYGCLCLLAGMYQVALGMQYGSHEVASAVLAHKWAIAFMVGIVVCGAFLIDAAIGPWPSRRFRAIWVVCAFAVVLWVENFYSVAGLRLANLNLTRTVEMPWGESILILSGDASPMKAALAFFVIAVIVYCLRLALRMRQIGDWVSTTLVLLILIGLLFTNRLSLLADAGDADIPYLGGFAVLGVSFGFLVLFGRDISRTLSSEFALRCRLTEEIEQLRKSDHVTQLPNLAGVPSLLNPMVEQHQQDGQALAVFMFDIERIEAFNSTHGPGVADAVHLAVTERLRARVRANDLVARGSGSSFLVVMSGLKRGARSPLRHQLHALHLHQKIDALFDEPFLVNGKELRLRCLTGLAIFPDDGATADALIASAELALHEAKLKGGGGVQTYHPALRDHVREQLELETELRAALDRKQLHLHYQPQIDSSDGRTVAFEALLRWTHPVLGAVPPDRFIPLAERSGLITSIGTWVLESAGGQLAKWRASGHPNLRMAINLSAHQLVQANITDIVTAVLQRYRLPPESLELEVTESALIQEPQKATANMKALKSLGVRLMLDDFGTGYSSLNYLRILPVDGFKLDRSFIKDIARSPRDLAICSTALQLANALNLEVVAEGVETSDQAEILAGEACDYFQGYWFSKPLPPEAADLFLRTAKTKAVFSFRRPFEETDSWLRRAWRASGPSSS